MSVLMKIFTWWEGATIGTLLYSRRNGRKIGSDALGNVYFETKKPVDGKGRRWVIYEGQNDASRWRPNGMAGFIIRPISCPMIFRRRACGRRMRFRT